MHEIRITGDLESNLKTLPDGLFEHLWRVNYLRLQNTGIKKIPEGMLDGLASLDMLVLIEDELRLEDLPQTLFDYTSKLNNLQTSIPELQKKNLTEIRRLVQKHGKPTKRKENIEEYGELLLKRLYANVGTSINNSALQKIELLKRLEQYDGVVECLQKLGVGDKIEDIFKRDGSKIMEFDNGEISLWLNLSELNLRSIPEGSFDTVPNLTSVLLSGNKITELSSETFRNNPRLGQLGLVQNQISHLSNQLLSYTPNLMVLDIRENQLTKLPVGIKNMEKLTDLYLLGNPIDIGGPNDRFGGNRTKIVFSGLMGMGNTNPTKADPILNNPQLLMAYKMNNPGVFHNE